MVKIPCSVAILTFNSEQTLPQCLASVSAFEDVYVVDGNSTDRTVSIAREYGASVYKQREETDEPVRIENFSEMRKRAESFAQCDWVLYLDSDEFLSRELSQEIEAVLKKNPSRETAFSVPYRMIVDGKIVFYSWNTPRYIRLYNKRSNILWKRKVVHEKMAVPPEVVAVPLTHFLYGYVPMYSERIKKDAYYLGLMRQKFRASGGGGLTTLRALFKNLGRPVKILLVMIWLYLCHGFKKTLPPLETWRYIRYHLIISHYRLLQLFSL